MTNRELAENGSFVIASTLLECPQCSYLSSSDELMVKGVPCPKCQSTDVRRIFPSLSAKTLLDMICYFYAKAYTREDDLRQRLVDDVQRETGRAYDADLLIDTGKEAKRLLNEEEDRDKQFSRTIGTVQERLSVQADANATRVLVIVLSYSDAFEERKAVAIFTCSMLETLFDDLLILLMTRTGLSRREATENADKLRSFPQRCKSFKKLTGISLKDAVANFRFFEDWESVREKRNDFVHGKPWSISSGIAEKAFDLAKEAFAVFADLHNRFCVM